MNLKENWMKLFVSATRIILMRLINLNIYTGIGVINMLICLNGKAGESDLFGIGGSA